MNKTQKKRNNYAFEVEVGRGLQRRTEAAPLIIMTPP